MKNVAATLFESSISRRLANISHRHVKSAAQDVFLVPRKSIFNDISKVDGLIPSL